MPLRSEYDREIVGLAVPALGALAAEPLYLLADTYVEPGRWGHGIGRSLLREALGRLARGEWDEVTLWVVRRNAQGRAFYTRSGFRLDGEIRRHQPSGVATARMRPPLVGTL